MPNNRASEPPAAIEGSEILIVGQDIKPAGLPKTLKGTHEIVFPLNVKRRGTGTITQENNPKQAKFKEYSMLDIGCSISGNVLWGFSSELITAGSIKRGGKGRISSHSGQELTIRGCCFLEIVQGWLGSPLTTHPKDELLSEN